MDARYGRCGFCSLALAWWAASFCSQRARPSSAACWWLWPWSGLVSLVSMQRRMRWSSSQTRAVTGRPGGGRQMLQRLAGMELDVAATTIGVAPDALRRAVDDGSSIAALAADAGVTSDRVVDAVVRDANTKVDRAVADGRIAPPGNQAARWVAQLGRTTRLCKRRECSPEPHRVPPDRIPPERQNCCGWRPSDRQFVCSWNATGLFGRDRVNATRFTVPDVSAAS